MTQHSHPSFVTRTMALVIDVVLLAATHLFMFFLLAGKVIYGVNYFEPLAVLSLYSFYLVVFIVSFVFLHMTYFTLFHAWAGQTIGKMLMGIKVITADGKPASPGVAFLRWTGYILSCLPFAAGFLWSAVDRDHCAWHDRLAQTKVVSVEMT